MKCWPADNVLDSHATLGLGQLSTALLAVRNNSNNVVEHSIICEQSGQTKDYKLSS